MHLLESGKHSGSNFCHGFDINDSTNILKLLDEIVYLDFITVLGLETSF